MPERLTNEDMDTSMKEEDEEEVDDEFLTSRLKEAICLFEDDKIFEAGRVLRKVMYRRTKKGQLCLDLLNDTHAMILKQCERESIVAELKSGIGNNAHDGWIYQGHTSISNLHTRIYYKLEQHQNKQILKCRLETPMPESMIIPFMSVLNETELFTTWLPHWSIPRLQIRNVEKLAQVGRVAQCLLMVLDIPWPMAAREVVFNVRGFDDTEARGEIFVHVTSDEDEFGNLVQIPPPDKKHIRMGYECSFLFRGLPKDYPLQEKYEEPTILVTCSLYADPKVSFIPQPLLNFATRIAIGTMWNQLLQVSMDVKDGKRSAHSQIIEQKQTTLYDWVHKRVEMMISKVSTQDGESMQN